MYVAQCPSLIYFFKLFPLVLSHVVFVTLTFLFRCVEILYKNSYLVNGAGSVSLIFSGDI